MPAKTDSRVLKHWEFAPFDLGCFLHQDKAMRLLREILKENGFCPVEPKRFHEKADILVPHCFGIFYRGNVIVYIASSGYGVARYPVEVATTDPLTQVAEALDQRFTFQRHIADSGYAPRLRGSQELRNR